MDVMVHLGDTITNAYSNQVIKGLETKVIIKFLTQLATQEPLTAFHDIKQTFFFEKKVQNGPLKKLPFSKPSILFIFLQSEAVLVLGSVE